ncbi:MAG: class I tRNA ligase family protein, partial [Candidatus Falkowbacteria bacterium]
SAISNDLEKYRLGRALQALYHFFWHEFCDIYIEAAKKQIREPKSKKAAANTQLILIYILATSLKLMHPWLPFITEEIYQLLPVKNRQALIVEDWPEIK